MSWKGGVFNFFSWESTFFSDLCLHEYKDYCFLWGQALCSIQRNPLCGVVRSLRSSCVQGVGFFSNKVGKERLCFYFRISFVYNLSKSDSPGLGYRSTNQSLAS